MSEIIPIDFPKNDNWLDKNPLPSPSAWSGLEKIMPALVDRFCGNTLGIALEFGVEFGYSAAVLAQLFDNVTGVDTFRGDVHSGIKSDHRELTLRNLEKWPNIYLYQMNYCEWIKHDTSRYALCHIDIVHTYEDTFACGRWAADHCDVLIAHDTESYPEVKRALSDIADETGRTFYNYPHCYGLGILVKS